MADRRIRSYWLILLAVLMTANMILSVEQTQAHYVNTAVWNTVIEADGSAVASDCLASVSDAPLTVLLGNMDEEKQTVSFTLASSKDTSGNLTWDVDKGEYLTVTMGVDGETVAKGAAVALTSAAIRTATMTLSLTEKATTTAHEAMAVNVTVSWGDSLKGTFRLTIPAVAEEDLPTEPTETSGPTEMTEPTEAAEPTEGTNPAPTEGEEPVAEVPEEPVTEVTEPVAPAQEEGGDEDATEEPTEGSAHTFEHEKSSLLSDSDPNQGENAVTESEPAATSATEPPATNPPATEPPATNPPATEPPATEPPATEPPATEPPATEPPATEPPTTEPPTTEPPATEPPATEPPATEPPSVDGEQKIMMNTIGVFTPDQKLPVIFTLTEGITKVRLGMGFVSDEETKLQPFPARTCYSMDNGASYYLMYYADMLEIEPKDSTKLAVLLDFSRVDMTEGADTVLAAEAYVNQSLIGNTSAETKTGTDALYRMDSRFLTRNDTLQIALTENWKDCTFTYAVEVLSADAAADTKGTEAGYMEVDASAWSDLVIDEENCALTFRSNETLPPAGTYRVMMNWSYEGTCFAKAQATFFINYSVYSETEGTGGTEQ